MAAFESSYSKGEVQILFFCEKRDTHFFAKVFHTIASNLYYPKGQSCPACPGLPEDVEGMPL